MQTVRSGAAAPQVGWSAAGLHKLHAASLSQHCLSHQFRKANGVLRFLAPGAGDGDVHLAFLPCYQVVENLRRGMAPSEAAEDAVRRIARRVPSYVGAVVAVGKDGRHGAAAHGWTFVYSFASGGTGGQVEKVQVEPLQV